MIRIEACTVQGQSLQTPVAARTVPREQNDHLTNYALCLVNKYIWKYANSELRQDFVF